MNAAFKRMCLWSLLALSIALPVSAQNLRVTDVANLEGADRQQRLIAEAKKEGSLMLYTSMTAANFDVLRADFEKKYGIKVNVWRAGDDKVLQRIITETKAGRSAFDLVHINTLEMEILHRENTLERVKSPHHKSLDPSAVPPHGEYAATRRSAIVLAYNTNQVKKEELPKTFQDLLDPKWKGRLGVEVKDQEWFYAVANSMGAEKGLKYFRDLVAANAPSVRTGHSLLNNLVVSGDIPLALTVYGHMPVLAKQKGAPIEWFTLEPTVAVSFAAGLSKKAPHPHAAMLFYDYMLSDAQKALAQMYYIPTNRNAESPFKGIDYKVVDMTKFVDEYSKWDALWETIVVKQGGAK
ncbi:MAG: transporter substrate-binding protein [Noviherbaspirillum sp.]|nr:transporter substrate-binding protein [Noviherbaspirillum sp.]